MNEPFIHRLSSAVPERKIRTPRWLRRGPLEAGATVLIAFGVLMLLQPFAIIIYTWSFITTLIGIVMFIVVSKFPE